jgi:putative hydrolase of the HAD superfamily
MVTPIWCMRLPGSMAGLALLAQSGLRLAVTSNSDGTVEAMLRRHEIVQVGAGPGVAVEVITDSGTLGVAKPDPAIFHATVAALGLEPHEVLHVGDSVHYDVHGARGAGLHAVLFDPYGVAVGDVPTVGSLAELVPLAASTRTDTLQR